MTSLTVVKQEETNAQIDPVCVTIDPTEEANAQIEPIRIVIVPTGETKVQIEAFRGPKGEKGEPGTIENVTIASIAGLPEALDAKQPKGNYLPADGTATDSARLGGKAPEYYLPADGIAADSARLGGVEASEFALKTGIPAAYTLPTATDETLGGVKSSEAVTVSADGTMTVNQLNGKSVHQYALKTDLPAKAEDVGARPDDWMPTAADVGALPADGIAADSAKLGGKAPEYYVQPRNLLDNSDFTNPVNQRGKESYVNISDEHYTIDRWIALGNTNVYVKNGYIEFSPRGSSGRGFRQRVINAGRLAGKTVTAAVKIKSLVEKTGIYFIADGVQTGEVITTAGIHVLTRVMPEALSNLSIQFGISGSDDANRIAVEWAALYEGSYAADTLSPYVPKGYADELLACEVADKGNIFGMDLLWENASPTSAFASQTVSLGLSGYSHVMIETRRYAPSPNIVNTIVPVGLNAIINTAYAEDGGYRYVIASRFIETETIANGILFQSGYGVNGIDAKTKDDTLQVPTRIYGIKGVGA